jgi:hypothetical protein
MPARIEIDCANGGWQESLESCVRVGGEVNLVNFEFATHCEFCMRLAGVYGVEFRPSRQPGTMEASIRNPWK